MNVVVVGKDVCLEAEGMHQQLYHLQTKSGNKDGIHFLRSSEGRVVLLMWSEPDMSINSEVTDCPSPLLSLGLTEKQSFLNLRIRPFISYIITCPTCK